MLFASDMHDRIISIMAFHADSASGELNDDLKLI